MNRRILFFVLPGELLDSLTRNHANEQYAWLYQVIDCWMNVILLHPGIVGIVLKRPSCGLPKLTGMQKFGLLSATAPNADQFSTWLTKLNSKPTHVLNSSWITTLVWHYIQHNIVEVISNSTG